MHAALPKFGYFILVQINKHVMLAMLNSPKRKNQRSKQKKKVDQNG
jgi:hypothetical protein